MNRHLLDDTVHKINSDDNKPLDTLIAEKTDSVTNRIDSIMFHSVLSSSDNIKETIVSTAYTTKDAVNSIVIGSFTAIHSGVLKFYANVKDAYDKSGRLIISRLSEPQEYNVLLDNNIETLLFRYPTVSVFQDLRVYSGETYYVHLIASDEYRVECSLVTISYDIETELKSTIKKIQRGFVEKSSEYVTVNIASVDWSKSFIYVKPNKQASTMASLYPARYTIPSNTNNQIGFMGGGSTNTEVIVSWQIIEFN